MAAVKDLCTRKVVSYAFSDRIDTKLTLAALDMAVSREKPSAGLIFHSDRGSQYAANAYRERLGALGFQQSMSRKDDPYDNTVRPHSALGWIPPAAFQMSLCSACAA